MEEVLTKSWTSVRVPRYGVCECERPIYLSSAAFKHQHPSVMIWTEKREKIQDVAAFQERFKGKMNMTNKKQIFFIITRL